MLISLQAKRLRKDGKMEVIHDCKGRIACMVDSTTGTVEAKYKDCIMSFCVPIGGSFVLKRRNVITEVFRNAEVFESKSQDIKPDFISDM